MTIELAIKIISRTCVFILLWRKVNLSKKNEGYIHRPIFFFLSTNKILLNKKEK